MATALPPRPGGRSPGILELQEGVTYERVAPIGAAVDGWLDADQTLPRLRARLVDKVLWFGGVFAATLSARRRLRRLIEQGKCDFVFVYDSSALRILPIVRLCRARGATSILDVVETPEQLGRGRSIGWDATAGLRDTPRLFDGLTVITSGLEAFYRERGCANTLILPSIESWPAAPAPGPTGNGTFRLTYLGTFLPRDDPETLVEAMRLLARRGAAVALDLVGHYDGTERGRRVRELCAGDEALGRAVRFLGSLSDAALEGQLASSDALVLTRRRARTEEMSFPTRLVELLRCGRPVLVSEVGDIPRYLRDGEVAFLAPGDPRQVAQAIAALASRPDRGAAIGQRGREAGARAFDRKAHAARLLDFVAGLSPRKGP